MVVDVMYKSARFDGESYKKEETDSLDVNKYWLEKSKRLNWYVEPTIGGKWQFSSPVSVSWFADGVLNACYNCVDRHAELERTQNKTAIIWISEDGTKTLNITYKQLLREVVSMSDTLRRANVKRGDRVVIYMSMIPEAVYAMLACARLGAVHSVVYGGFSSECLKDRIIDCGATVVVTAMVGHRAGRVIPIKSLVDAAVSTLSNVKKVIVVNNTDKLHVCLTPDIKNSGTESYNIREEIYELYVPNYEAHITPERMNAEDYLFIIYTSGSTGKPKGLVHTTGGYLTHVSTIYDHVFDMHNNDILWCTGDLGWISGHSYAVYGSLANCSTTVIYEGALNYPTPDRMWKIVDQVNVTVLFTSPTTIRLVMEEGDKWLETSQRNSLRLLGSKGAPNNEGAWKWYFNKVGKGRCPIVNMWGQTEAGGVMMRSISGIQGLKPSSALQPFFSIDVALLPTVVTSDLSKSDLFTQRVDEVTENPGEGQLVIKRSWPGQSVTIYGDHSFFERCYFTQYPGYYFTGDCARRDADGDYCITGRIDDVLNVSGSLFSTFELETAATKSNLIVEAAVVGFEHYIKGEGIAVFAIAASDSNTSTEDLEEIVKMNLCTCLGPVATPDIVSIVKGLPKTRSGKIMRRILKCIAREQYDSIGDTSTLVNPDVVNDIIILFKNKLQELKQKRQKKI